MRQATKWFFQAPYSAAEIVCRRSGRADSAHIGRGIGAAERYALTPRVNSIDPRQNMLRSKRHSR
jgi:hypothetical protein